MANRKFFVLEGHPYGYHLCHHSSKIRCSFTRPTGAVSNEGASGGSSWQRKIENKDKSMMKFAMISSWISHTQEKTHGIQTMFIHFGTETTCHLPAFGFIIGPMEHMEWLQRLQWPVKKVLFVTTGRVSPDDVPRDSCDASCRSSFTKSQVDLVPSCVCAKRWFAALDSSSHGFKSMGCNEYKVFSKREKQRREKCINIGLSHIGYTNPPWFIITLALGIDCLHPVRPSTWTALVVALFAPGRPLEHPWSCHGGLVSLGQPSNIIQLNWQIFQLDDTRGSVSCRFILKISLP